MMEAQLGRNFCATLEPELVKRIFELRRAVADAAMLAADLATLTQAIDFLYASETELAEHAPTREALQSDLGEVSSVLTELHQDLVTATLEMPKDSGEPSR